MIELRRALPFLLLPLVLALAGCGILPWPMTGAASSAQPPLRASVTLDELAARRAAWAASGPGTYTWRVSYSCECAVSGPVTITVVDGIATRATGEGGVIALDRLTGFPLTVTALLDRAIEAVQGGGEVTATWQGPVGAPNAMLLDPIPNAVDDEVSVTVVGLVPGP
jgi:hypothetical protein